MPSYNHAVNQRLRHLASGKIADGGLSLRSASAAIGEVDGKPIVPFTTLADWLRGHLSGAPHRVSHLTLPQAEAVARWLGLRLRLVKPS